MSHAVRYSSFFRERSTLVYTRQLALANTATSGARPAANTSTGLLELLLGIRALISHPSHGEEYELRLVLGYIWVSRITPTISRCLVSHGHHSH